MIESLRQNAPDALALARAEVDAAPGNAEAHHLLGLAQRVTGDVAAARASFDKAIELAPNEPVYHLSRALLARAQGDLALADSASARSLALDPNRFDTYLLRIQLALAAGDFAEAERQIEMAERADREHPQLLFLAGQVALLKGDGERAVRLLGTAAIEQPRDAQVFATLGMAYQQQGHFAFAEQALRKALELDPDQTRWRRLLVEALSSQNRNDAAEAELAVYRKDHPQDPGGMALQGELRLRAGQTAAALADFRAALRQMPRDMRALAGLQNTLVAIGDPALMRGAWEGVLQDEAGLDTIWMTRLLASADDADYDDVLRRWRAALPTSVPARLHQARRDGYIGRDDEAEADYDAVLASAPTQFEALTGKAAIALHRDPAAGILRLDALIAQASPLQAPAALAIRGQARDRLGQLPEAIADWQQARAAFGTDPVDRPLPPATANALIANLPPDPAEAQVVMLWGAPGSGSERIVAALRTVSTRPLLQPADARTVSPRKPNYPESFVARALNAAELPGVVNEMVPVYARMLEPHLTQGRKGVFDWLAQWDARMVPALRRVLPGTRLIATIRDPRDMLLNWLAFGAQADLKFGDPIVSARWLAGQLEHLLFSRDDLHLPVLIVEMDRFDADPAAGVKEIAAFAGLSSAPDPQPAVRMQVDSWRLPTLLPVGRWRAYHELLAGAFDVLAPVAERLGYPRS
ncbi:MAG TPA: tetratricopeptide repeat protein [Xanthomonadaceae bacterium]|nr:tetratricopeptide repeat protein [Xanthomonadaceae bacterium]